MGILQLFVFLGSFIIIWYGAGKIVSSADKFSKKLKVSSFAFSFLVLGILTSTPEFAVGITAVSENKPEIFVGNLIGGIPVLFLFVIPMLSIFGNGLQLKKAIRQRNLILSFVVMLAPAFFLLDHKINIFESILFIVMYLGLLFAIQREKGLLDNGNSALMNVKSYSMKDILNVFFGVGLVFVASHYIVDGALYYAQFFNVSTFFISVIILSIGTNLPELSLAAKSVLTGKKDVAFGDYVGSGAANTFLFGLFGIIYGKGIEVGDNLLISFLILCIGLFTFFLFAKSKNELSRKEGIVLVILFLAFGAFQIG